jgi:hypothetical protein
MTALRERLPDILRYRAEGLSDAAISLLLGIPPPHIGRLAGCRGDRGKPHDPKLTTRARRLWNLGASASEIAQRLTTEARPLTRDAIIGIAHRHGFPARPSPIKRWAA